ncbi:MAG: hypothetical protein K8S00_04190 [Bacteroidales bacterium]|nr:hypothetical protein [Bacteroidales bacterium]
MGRLESKSSKVKIKFENRVGGKDIVTKLSYSHLEDLFRIDDDLKRF